jgi:hypothetical protein
VVTDILKTKNNLAVPKADGKSWVTKSIPLPVLELTKDETLVTEETTLAAEEPMGETLVTEENTLTAEEPMGETLVTEENTLTAEEPMGETLVEEEPMDLSIKREISEDRSMDPPEETTLSRTEEPPLDEEETPMLRIIKTETLELEEPGECVESRETVPEEQDTEQVSASITTTTPSIQTPIIIDPKSLPSAPLPANHPITLIIPPSSTNPHPIIIKPLLNAQGLHVIKPIVREEGLGKQHNLTPIHTNLGRGFLVPNGLPLYSAATPLPPPPSTQNVEHSYSLPTSQTQNVAQVPIPVPMNAQPLHTPPPPRPSTYQYLLNYPPSTNNLPSKPTHPLPIPVPMDVQPLHTPPPPRPSTYQYLLNFPPSTNNLPTRPTHPLTSLNQLISKLKTRMDGERSNNSAQVDSAPVIRSVLLKPHEDIAHSFVNRASNIFTTSTAPTAPSFCVSTNMLNEQSTSGQGTCSQDSTSDIPTNTLTTVGQGVSEQITSSPSVLTGGQTTSSMVSNQVPTGDVFTNTLSTTHKKKKSSHKKKGAKKSKSSKRTKKNGGNGKNKSEKVLQVQSVLPLKKRKITTLENNESVDDNSAGASPLKARKTTVDDNDRNNESVDDSTTNDIDNSGAITIDDDDSNNESVDDSTTNDIDNTGPITIDDNDSNNESVDDSTTNDNSGPITQQNFVRKFKNTHPSGIDESHIFRVKEEGKEDESLKTLVGIRKMDEHVINGKIYDAFAIDANIYRLNKRFIYPSVPIWDMMASIPLSDTTMVSPYQKMIGRLRTKFVKIIFKDYPKRGRNPFLDEGIELSWSQFCKLGSSLESMKPLLKKLQIPLIQSIIGASTSTASTKLPPMFIVDLGVGVILRVTSGKHRYPIELRRQVPHPEQKSKMLNTTEGHHFTVLEWVRFMKVYPHIYHIIVKSIQ